MADLCYSDPLSSIAWNVECGGRMNVGRKCNDNRRHERWWRAQWTGMKSKRGTQGNDERKYLLIPIKYNQFNDGYIKPQVQTCLLWIRNTLINSIMKWIQCFLHVNDEWSQLYGASTTAKSERLGHSSQSFDTFSKQHQNFWESRHI